MKVKVIEIFNSIQGEGVHVGRPCTFVRFAGCNLSCSFCDTKQGNLPAMDMSVEEIAYTIRRLERRYVVFTGGEPCLHLDEINKIIGLESSDNISYAIETNGTRPIPRLIDWVTISPKEGGDIFDNNIQRADELKYVVNDNFDPSVIDGSFTGPIWLQPESSNMLRNWDLCYKHAAKLECIMPNIRVGIQMHKVIGVR